MKQYTNGPQVKEVPVNFSTIRRCENDSYLVKIVLEFLTLIFSLRSQIWYDSLSCDARQTAARAPNQP